jgi:hypothetical protein
MVSQTRVVVGGTDEGVLEMGTRVRVQEAIEDMKLDEFVAAYGNMTEWELENPEAQIKQLEKDIAMAKAAGMTQVRFLPALCLWRWQSLACLGELKEAVERHQHPLLLRVEADESSFSRNLRRGPLVLSAVGHLADCRRRWRCVSTVGGAG